MTIEEITALPLPDNQNWAMMQSMGGGGRMPGSSVMLAYGNIYITCGTGANLLRIDSTYPMNTPTDYVFVPPPTPNPGDDIMAAFGAKLGVPQPPVAKKVAALFFSAYFSDRDGEITPTISKTAWEACLADGSAKFGFTGTDHSATTPTAAPTEAPPAGQGNGRRLQGGFPEGDEGRRLQGGPSFPPPFSFVDSAGAPFDGAVEGVITQEDFAGKCTSTMAFQVAKDFADTVQEMGSVTTRESLHAARSYVNALSMRAATGACMHLITSLYTQVDEAYTLPGSKACTFIETAAGWATDPCCNPALLWSQCCAAREAPLTVKKCKHTDGVCDVVDEELSKAKVLYRETIKVYIQDVVAPAIFETQHPELGCAKTAAKSANEKSWDRETAWMQTCQMKVFYGTAINGQSKCNTDSECFSGQCTDTRCNQVTGEGAIEPMFRCMMHENANSDILKYLSSLIDFDPTVVKATTSGTDFDEAKEKFSLLVADQNCAGREAGKGWCQNSRTKAQCEKLAITEANGVTSVKWIDDPADANVGWCIMTSEQTPDCGGQACGWGWGYAHQGDAYAQAACNTGTLALSACVVSTTPTDSSDRVPDETACLGGGGAWVNYGAGVFHRLETQKVWMQDPKTFEYSEKVENGNEAKCGAEKSCNWDPDGWEGATTQALCEDRPGVDIGGDQFFCGRCMTPTQCWSRMSMGTCVVNPHGQGDCTQDTGTTAGVMPELIAVTEVSRPWAVRGGRVHHGCYREPAYFVLEAGKKCTNTKIVTVTGTVTAASCGSAAAADAGCNADYISVKTTATAVCLCATTADTCTARTGDGDYSVHTKLFHNVETCLPASICPENEARGGGNVWNRCAESFCYNEGLADAAACSSDDGANWWWADMKYNDATGAVGLCVNRQTFGADKTQCDDKGSGWKWWEGRAWIGGVLDTQAKCETGYCKDGQPDEHSRTTCGTAKICTDRCKLCESDNRDDDNRNRICYDSSIATEGACTGATMKWDSTAGVCRQETFTGDAAACTALSGVFKDCYSFAAATCKARCHLSEWTTQIACATGSGNLGGGKSTGWDYDTQKCYATGGFTNWGRPSTAECDALGAGTPVMDTVTVDELKLMASLQCRWNNWGTCPDEEACGTSGQCEDWFLERQSPSGERTTSACVVDIEVHTTKGQNHQAGERKWCDKYTPALDHAGDMGCIDSTLTTAAACTAAGHSWKTKAATKAECEAHGDLCRDKYRDQQIFGGFTTRDTCESCDGSHQFEKKVKWNGGSWQEPTMFKGAWKAREWASQNSWGKNLARYKLRDLADRAVSMKFGEVFKTKVICKFNPILEALKVTGCGLGEAATDAADPMGGTEACGAVLGGGVIEVVLSEQTCLCSNLAAQKVVDLGAGSADYSEAECPNDASTILDSSNKVVPTATLVERRRLSAADARRLSTCSSHAVVANLVGGICGQKMGTAFSTKLNNVQLCITTSVPEAEQCAEYIVKDFAQVYANGTISPPLKLTVTVDAQGRYCAKAPTAGAFMPIKAIVEDCSTVAAPGALISSANPSSSNFCRWLTAGLGLLVAMLW